MPTRIRLRDEEHEWTIELRGTAALVDGVSDPFEIAESSDGRWRVTHAARSDDAIGISAGGVVWVQLAGELFDFQVASDEKASRPTTRGRDGLTPPMSATVVRIAVKVGERVAQGDTLVVLEAMKMELPIRSPQDGVVTALHCREGELVQPGTVLVDIA